MTPLHGTCVDPTPHSMVRIQTLSTNAWCNIVSARRLDADAANMVGCYFHAHRPQDGQWLPADAMPKSDTGQPIAYVAKGAHGLYTSVSAWSGVQVPA